MPRWYTEIGWELGEEARIYIVNSVTSLEIGSQSTNFRHISYASTGTACATGGEMGERGRGGRGQDLREPRSSYVTISVPNIKPINFKHLSRFVWTKPRVCSLFLDVFFFLPFSFYFFFFPIFFFVYRCLSMFMNILGFLLFPPARYWGIQSVMIYLDSLKSKQQSNKLQNIKIK